jgi:hypothetical protein
MNRFNLTKNNWWKWWIAGFVVTFLIDFGIFYYLIYPINPEWSMAMAGRLEIVWTFSWLIYCSYKLDI